MAVHALWDIMAFLVFPKRYRPATPEAQEAPATPQTPLRPAVPHPAD